MKFVYLSLIMIISTLLLSVPTFAIEGNGGMSLSPLRTEFDIKPGTVQTGSLTISNTTSQVMNVSFDPMEFDVINQQYDYAFTSESDVIKWVSFDQKNLELKAGESKKINYNIGVPLSAEPGGRYISIFVSNDTKSNEDGIVSRQRIASMVYITVTGEVTRSGELISLNTPWLVVNNNQWSAVMRNSGSTHYRSRFNTALSDIFGNNIGGYIQGESMILPGTVKLLNNEFKLPTWPGIYTVTYTIGLGDNPARLEKRYLLYLPSWSILTFAGILVSVKIFTSRRKKTDQSV